METNKDFLIRNIKKISEIIGSLFNKGSENEELNVVINNFITDEFDVTFDLFLEKSIEEVISLINLKKYSTPEIKELSDIIYIKFKIEKKNIIKKEIAILAVKMYNYYATLSKKYCIENNIKSEELLNFIEK